MHSPLYKDGKLMFDKVWYATEPRSAFFSKTVSMGSVLATGQLAVTSLGLEFQARVSRLNIPFADITSFTVPRLFWDDVFAGPGSRWLQVNFGSETAFFADGRSPGRFRYWFPCVDSTQAMADTVREAFEIYRSQLQSSSLTTKI